MKMPKRLQELINIVLYSTVVGFSFFKFSSTLKAFLSSMTLCLDLLIIPGIFFYWSMKERLTTKLLGTKTENLGVLFLSNFSKNSRSRSMQYLPVVKKDLPKVQKPGGLALSEGNIDKEELHRKILRSRSMHQVMD